MNPEPISPPLIVDAHEDLAFNMLVLGRDYTRSAAETRRLEAGSEIPGMLGDTMLGWPDYQRGRVAVVFSTLFASPYRPGNEAWDRFTYRDVETAHRLYWDQLDAYHRLVDEHPDQFRLLEARRDLDEVLAKWAALPPESPSPAPREGDEPVPAEAAEAVEPPSAPVGLCVLMEGAEGVRDPSDLEAWWARGVRLIGLAWAGNRFCGGTGAPGPLTSEGYALLEAMASLGFALDLSHMDAQSALQALDVYPGTILASHANAARLLKGLDSNRHLPDVVIQRLLDRDGMIGVVPYNRFLLPGWEPGDGRQAVGLDRVVAQIDMICQMAGDALHVGLGTDFDGGFGLQSVPDGLDTIADLQSLAPLLAQKGYSQGDIAAIFGQNWLYRLSRILP
jgi:membrane dipeptidase